jgi:hypothetical protein
MTYLVIDLVFEVAHSQFPAGKAELNITGIEKMLMKQETPDFLLLN